MPRVSYIAPHTWKQRRVLQGDKLNGDQLVEKRLVLHKKCVLHSDNNTSFSPHVIGDQFFILQHTNNVVAQELLFKKKT
jgi:hypothetical protein